MAEPAILPALLPHDKRRWRQKVDCLQQLPKTVHARTLRAFFL